MKYWFLEARALFLSKFSMDVLSSMSIKCKFVKKVNSPILVLSWIPLLFLEVIYMHLVMIFISISMKLQTKPGHASLSSSLELNIGIQNIRISKWFIFNYKRKEKAADAFIAISLGNLSWKIQFSFLDLLKIPLGKFLVGLNCYSPVSLYYTL